MPLIDLKTNLKSLKYGKDRPGGGDSGQPYITNDINDPKNVLGLDDGLVRGGAVGALKSSVTDAFRIGKFLTDLPKGPLFIVKQVGLQFSNPKLEVKKSVGGFLSSLLTGDLGPATGGALQPTRLYNLGINTLAQVPVNAFGVHFNRHGLLPVQDESTKYLAVVTANNKGNSKNNRLVNYLDTKLNVTTIAGKKTSLLQKLINLIPIVKGFAQPKQQTLNSYLGGPGSVYGVGTTLIKRYDYTTVHEKQNNQLPQVISKIGGNPGNVQYLGDLGVSKYYFYSPFDITEGDTALDVNNITNNGKTINPPSAIAYKSNNAVGKYFELQQKVAEEQKLKNTNSVGIYNSVTNGTKIDNTKGNYITTNLGAGNIQYKNSYGDVVKIKGYSSWNEVARENRVGSFGEAKYLVAVSGSNAITKTVRAADQINLTPLFEVPGTAKSIGDKVTINKTEFLIRDLVKFRIQAVDGDDPTKTTYMVFRAYVTQYSDSVNANWNNVKYAGRGENFYIYGGFDRSISINFKVAALSAVEMEPMYQKLNYLMGNLMPDYKDNLLMRGPMTRMTIGNWLDGQDGIITALTYNVPQDSPWEISLGEDATTGVNTLNLPHIVEVNMTFLPIGSQTKGENKISSKSSTTSHIAQNVNDYQFIGNKYTSNNTIPQVK